MGVFFHTIAIGWECGNDQRGLYRYARAFRVRCRIEGFLLLHFWRDSYTGAQASGLAS
jgi:hypothetical protein